MEKVTDKVSVTIALRPSELESIDKDAKRRGMSREALLSAWLGEMAYIKQAAAGGL